LEVERIGGGAVNPPIEAPERRVRVSQTSPGEGSPGSGRVRRAHAELGFVRRYVFSTDHKVIGLQFLFSGLFFLAVGGALAMAMRHQLAWPWRPVPGVASLFPETGGAMTPEFYTALLTMHGTLMIFFVVIPLLNGAFGNFLIPLLIGAPDMAFPKLNLLGYWLMVPAFACAMASFFVEGGAASAGWTAYPPLSTLGSAHAGQTLWIVALTFVGIASLLGSINYVTTIVKMRAPGLSMMRLPLSVWGLFIAALLQLFALPVLTSAGVLQLLDRTLHTGFFTPQNLLVNNLSPEAADIATGGQPLLWQHLFWFYSHPAVYVMVLPAMGIVSDVIAVNARKPIFGYRPMVYSLIAIATLGFIVWGHHMFTSGMNPAIGMAFMLSTIMIALPSAIKVFNWLATLWRARIRLSAAMLYALGFLSMFIVGGLSGIWMAATPVDVYIHDTYIVVAHFHYLVMGGSVLALFAAIHHWFPKMFGRRMNEPIGKLHFAGTFVLTNGVFFMMHHLGLAGLHRRTADPYEFGIFAQLQPINQMITFCAFALFAWQILFVINFFHSMFWGVRVGRNPWQANTLEWEAPSPARHGNFDRPLRVLRGPYEYAVRDVPEDFVPQTKQL
jgi:cytochrome c oxidase subunit 1